MIFRSNLKKKPVVVDCIFCKRKTEPNFIEGNVLSRFVSDRGKILPRNKTSFCQRHQRKLSKAVKQARYLALLPFSVKP